MSNDFKDREEAEFVRRFEEMLRNKEVYFFDIEAYESIIDYYISMGKLEEALQACNFALEQYPYSTDLTLDKAHLLINMGEYLQALELLEGVENLHPNDLDTMLLKGTALCLSGKYQEAVETLEHTLPFADDKPEVYYNIGVAYQTWGRYEKAIEQYQKALLLDMGHERALQELFYCWEFLEKLEEGIAFFEKLIDESPYTHLAWYHLGMVYFKLLRYEDAVQAFEYVNLIQIDFVDAYFYTGASFMNMQKYTDARIAFLKVLEYEQQSTAQADVLCHIAATFEKSEEYPKALEYYQKAAKSDPYWDEAWYGASVCLDALDRWYEALHFIKKAQQLDPHNPTYIFALANIEYRIGNIASAIEAYEQAADIEPYNIDVWLNWSFVYYEQGNYEQAIAIMEEAIDEIPEEGELYYRQASYMIEAGRYKEAFEHLENALLLDFDKHTLLYDFFTSLETQKALHKIIEQYRPK